MAKPDIFNELNNLLQSPGESHQRPDVTSAKRPKNNSMAVAGLPTKSSKVAPLSPMTRNRDHPERVALNRFLHIPPGTLLRIASVE